MKMRSMVALLLGTALFFTLVMVAGAQEKKKESLDRVQGTIQVIDRGSNTITVRPSGGTAQRQVVYSDSTKIMKVNEPGGTVDDLKEGVRINCVGKFNSKTQLEATTISIRLPR